MRILAAGCSFTAGLELPDCLYTNFGVSKYAYPALLGNLYNAEVTNISLSGGSNGRIFRKIIDETSRTNYDLIMCGWTSIDRLDLQYKNEDIPSAPGGRYLDNFQWTKTYYTDHHSYYHASQTWYAQLISLQSYLKLSNQKYIFLSMMTPVSDMHKDQFPYLLNKIDSKYFIGWPDQGMVDFMGDCPKGPGGHPLELGHQRIADKINEHIRNLGWVS